MRKESFGKGEQGIFMRGLFVFSLFDSSSYEKEKDTGDVSNALIASVLPFLFRSSCLCVKISSCLLEKEQCQKSGKFNIPSYGFEVCRRCIWVLDTISGPMLHT